MLHPHWDPSKHPRYHNGRFRPRLTQSLRISPLSASYNVGVRVPVVPGKIAAYVGVLARVENTAGQAALNRLGGRVADRAFGGKLGKSRAGALVRGAPIRVGGATVSRSRIVSAPTVRVNNRRATVHPSKSYTTASGRVRQPRKARKPRQRAIASGRRVR